MSFGCPNCFTPYEEGRVVRKMLNCGHPVCSGCVTERTESGFTFIACAYSSCGQRQDLNGWNDTDPLRYSPQETQDRPLSQNSTDSGVAQSPNLHSGDSGFLPMMRRFSSMQNMQQQDGPGRMKVAESLYNVGGASFGRGRATPLAPPPVAPNGVRFTMPSGTAPRTANVSGPAPGAKVSQATSAYGISQSAQAHRPAPPLQTGRMGFGAPWPMSGQQQFTRPRGLANARGYIPARSLMNIPVAIPENEQVQAPYHPNPPLASHGPRVGSPYGADPGQGVPRPDISTFGKPPPAPTIPQARSNHYAWAPQIQHGNQELAQGSTQAQGGQAMSNQEEPPTGRQSPNDPISHKTVSCGSYCQLVVTGSGNTIYLGNEAELVVHEGDNRIELKNRLPAICPPQPDLAFDDGLSVFLENSCHAYTKGHSRVIVKGENNLVVCKRNAGQNMEVNLRA